MSNLTVKPASYDLFSQRTLILFKKAFFLIFRICREKFTGGGKMLFGKLPIPGSAGCKCQTAMGSRTPGDQLKRAAVKFDRIFRVAAVKEEIPCHFQRVGRAPAQTADIFKKCHDK